MFDIDARDLDNIADDIVNMIDPAIKSGAKMGSTSVVNDSPVLTGAFKGNWNVSIDSTFDGSLSVEDPSGVSTLAKMISEINSFSVKKNDMLFIQNNVLNDEEGEYYAEYVGYDFSGSTALSVIRGAVTAVDAIR